jgi:hypothetical protein
VEQRKQTMAVDYLQFPGEVRSYSAAPERSSWAIMYRERKALTHVDGYMIVYGQRCLITLSTSLTADQKQLAVNELLRRLPQMVQPARQIFLWSLSSTLSSC